MAQKRDDDLNKFKTLKSSQRIVIRKNVDFPYLEKLDRGFTYERTTRFFYPGDEIRCRKCKETSWEVKCVSTLLVDDDDLRDERCCELSKMICLACHMRQCRWGKGKPCSDCMAREYFCLNEENEEPDETFIEKAVEHFTGRDSILTKAAR